jgi:pentose-5-phosphate-3-epimerase
MKISASLYSSREKNLEKLVRDLDHHRIDCFHIDSNDDLSVFEDIARIRKISSTPIDLHIISSEPEKFLRGIEDQRVEFVQFQYENLKEKFEIPRLKSTTFGLAIVSDSPVEVVNPFQNDISFVLLMTTIPGQSGGVFRKESFQKIRKLRNRYPDKKIHVDGGVNDEVSFILRNMGVSLVVSGSYLVNNTSIGAALLNMRTHDIDSRYQIRDFMIDLEDCPVLPVEDSSFSKIIRTIDQYNLGFVFYTDHKGVLKGLTSNADVRKGIIKKLDDLNKIELQDIWNQNPVCINQNQDIGALLKLIKSQKFLVNFLPVVDDDHRLAGALTFFNLIRGES